MEFTIRTMMIVVLGVIALLVIITFLIRGQSQSQGVLDSIFGWFRSLG